MEWKSFVMGAGAMAGFVILLCWLLAFFLKELNDHRIDREG